MSSIFFAFYQLSRFPLPAVPFNEIACGRSTAYFPLVGLVLGAALAGLNWAAAWIFPEQVRAALLVVAMVLLTGGIHLDGYMDSVDGLFSGRPRARKLEIMRDSRVGAFGVIGALCLLVLKYSLFLGLPQQVLPYLVIVTPAVSRWGMTLAIRTFPYARPEGLGKIFASYTGLKELGGATLIAAIAAFAALGLQGILLMALGGAATLLVGRAVTRELGGLTGDTYGFINELVEVILLLAAYPVLLADSGI